MLPQGLEKYMYLSPSYYVVAALKIFGMQILCISCCNNPHPKTQNTVNSPNSGHFGTTAFVLYLESVLYWGVL